MPVAAKIPNWISVPRPNPRAERRLYCLPYAGGSAAVYRPWLGVAPASVELRLVEYPGRGVRFGETPASSIESLADALADAIAREPAARFALFGHSMGGSLAYETGLRLESMGRAPDAIVVSATPAPHVPDRDEPVSHLPRAELLAKLRELGGTPPEVLAHDELLDLLLPVLRADFSACERYDTRERPALGVPLFAYGGARDERITVDDVRAWSKYTRARFATRVFPGGHFFLHDDRDAVLAALATDLAGV